MLLLLVFASVFVTNYALPQSTHSCKLLKDPTVEYNCTSSNNILYLNGKLVTAEEECDELQPSGAVVRPYCRDGYFSPTPLSHFHCVDGQWDYSPQCMPDCGRLTDNGTLPWHALIYRKTTSPYQRICAGVIVKPTIIMTAAHCVTSNSVDPLVEAVPASYIAVALGKVHQQWNHEDDVHAQKSDVSEIHVHPRYYGDLSNYQNDIAILILQKDIVFGSHIRPVCLDFNNELEKKQLTDGAIGKAVVFNNEPEKPQPSSTARVIGLPILEMGKCLRQSPADFIHFITGDKACITFTGDNVVCPGESGVGLSFPSQDQDGTVRYYLRGIVTHGSSNQTRRFCKTGDFGVMTLVSLQEHFSDLDYN